MEEEVFGYSDDAFSIKICRDGMVKLRIEALENHGAQQQTVEYTVKRWGEYLDYLNAFYLFLDSAVITTMRLAYFNLHEITVRDAIRIRYENGKEAGYNVPTESVAATFQMARHQRTYGSIPIEHDPRISLRQVISLEAISRAVASFKAVVSKPGVEKVFASFTKSIAEYKVGNYETSIILAWFISERIMANLWGRHIDSLNKDQGDGQQRINRKRKDTLTGRDFPISVVSNLLELWDILPFSLFKDLDTVRGFRNDIVHGETNYEPSAKDAQLAINTARELSIRSNQIDFTPSLSFGVMGL